MLISKANVNDHLQDSQALSALNSGNPKPMNTLLPISKQQDPFKVASSRGDFAHITTEIILNPSRSSTHNFSFVPTPKLSEQRPQSHPLRHFVDDWPKNQSDCSTIMWPDVEEMQSDRAQLSISMPMASSGFSSSSSSPNQEKLTLSPLKLSRDFDPIHMGLGIGGVLNEVKPYLAMVFLQFGYAGMFVISVESLKRGMNHYVLVVYRNAIAVAAVAPFAMWFERKVRPKMTLSIFLKTMALALLEPVLDQNFYYVGANLTSASFASALFNILPAITFLLAIVLRIETMNLRRRRSQAKLVGTIVTVAGALLMILYKGPVLDFVWSKGRSHNTAVGQNGSNSLKGTLMLLGGCFCCSSFYILQSNTLESYPAELTLTTLICLMGALMSSLVALVAERGSAKPWIIGWDTRLLAAAYSGVLCSGVAYYVQGKVMKERGPVFVTAFNPLCMIVTAVLGSIVLAEEITLGSVIGAAVIVIGLYSLIWGKSKDHLKQHSESSEKKGEFELPTAIADAGKSGRTTRPLLWRSRLHQKSLSCEPNLSRKITCFPYMRGCLSVFFGLK
ncbi:WAT1-related protein At1g21890-like [Phoenix dactylifera]|uniref:WAT1-related protein At1g21890-like n=1 Tax=Phoenix dactylifera TaxID=42345 RepID=A0A8B9B3I1_PHODC|nr:WAT1-related protein At1g21890-like [Phoenix dactylifera]